MAQTFSRWVVRHGYLARTILVLIGVLAMVSLLTVPFFNNARSMTTKIGKMKMENKELADKVSVLSGLDQEVLDERVRILDRALPPRKDIVLYLSAIDGLSRELNLSFGGISLSPGEVTEATGAAAKAKAQTKSDLPGLNTLETEIEITGDQQNIYTFLRLIEESAPLMQITDVKVNGLSDETYALSLKLGMLYAVTDIKAVNGPITLFDEKEEQYFQDLAGFRNFESLSDVTVQDTTLGKSNLFEAITPQQ